MDKKIILVIITAFVGAGLGAYLGFGPLKTYKSEGVLNLDLGAGEYKRISDVASDSTKMLQFMSKTSPAKAPEPLLPPSIAAAANTEWHKPILRLSKLDIKEIPDLLFQMERDREKDKVKEKDSAVKSSNVYSAIRVIGIASDPATAREVAIWLGRYFRDLAALDSLRDLVVNWKNENRQFLDRSIEQKLRLGFEMQQAETRLATLRKIVTKYPDTVLREGRQAVGVPKETEKFLSPMAMLFSAESQIIDVNEKLQKLSYQTEQHIFISPLLVQAESALKQSITSDEMIKQVSQLIVEHSYKTKTNAEREKILSLGAELSQIKIEYIESTTFNNMPYLPTKAEGGSPIKLIILMSILFAVLMAAYQWRAYILNLINQDDVKLVEEN